MSTETDRRLRALETHIGELTEKLDYLREILAGMGSKASQKPQKPALPAQEIEPHGMAEIPAGPGPHRMGRGY